MILGLFEGCVPCRRAEKLAGNISIVVKYHGVNPVENVTTMMV